MGHILYGVQGEGKGHMTRSLAVIEQLSKHHEITLVGSSSVCSFFSSHKELLKDMLEVDHLKIIYHNNGVAGLSTIMHNIWTIPSQYASLRTVLKYMKKNKTEMVITDFEHISSFASHIRGIPLLAIDNEHVISDCEITVPGKWWWQYMKSRIVIWIMVPQPDVTVIPSFFFPYRKKKNAWLIPPLHRE